MAKPKSRRRNYFVKKKFQANFFLKFVGLLLLEGLMIYALFMYVSKGTLTAAYRGTEFTIQNTGSFFLTDFVVIVSLVGAAVAIMGVFVFMYLSHRIGGALYRFEKTLEAAKDGDFIQRVKLRRTDELHDLNHQMNLFLEAMDVRVGDLKRGITQALSIVKESGGDDRMKRIEDALKNLRSGLDQMRTSK
ncbi:MAG: methyl-accepting chemotaxis protein [Candidatus Omnitrophica bacterium]|nr:methyl-accepting chemotaxis protein [Candidatus Omnitrophota bacterium]